jgi:signal peptidase I
MEPVVRVGRAERAASCLTCFLNLVLIVGLAMIAVVVLPATIQIVRVQGDSMTPSLLDGQLLLVSRLAYRFHAVNHGDIIVFKSPESPDTILVKRVIGLPGENIALKQGRLFLDSHAITEPYVMDGDRSGFGPLGVKKDMLFVMGDHRTVSNDSRSWGLLPQNNILGRAEFSIWPPSSIP